MIEGEELGHGQEEQPPPPIPAGCISPAIGLYEDGQELSAAGIVATEPVFTGPRIVRAIPAPLPRDAVVFGKQVSSYSLGMMPPVKK